MTRNQIAYQEHLENVRKNRTSEDYRGKELGETKRSNQAREQISYAQISSNEKIAESQNLNNRVIAAMNNQSRERISRMGNTNQAMIAELDRLSREDIAEADRLARELGPLGILADKLADADLSGLGQTVSYIAQNPKVPVKVAASNAAEVAKVAGSNAHIIANVATEAIPRILKGVITR